MARWRREEDRQRSRIDKIRLEALGLLIPAGEALRVLVVEDDFDAAESLRSLLVTCGYQVVVAHTSQQGIEAARKLEPHIVLCDIGLPDSDGYVVGSVLRQSGHSAAALLIAVTGYGEPQHRLRALAAGFDQHLVKPVDTKVLLREMQTTH
jgi:CheY-like chemotaxis protein